MSIDIFSPQFALIVDLVALGAAMVLWGLDKTEVFGKDKISKFVGWVYVGAGFFMLYVGMRVFGIL